MYAISEYSSIKGYITLSGSSGFIGQFRNLIGAILREEFQCLFHDAFGIEPVFFTQQSLGTVFDEFIGDADIPYLNLSKSGFLNMSSIMPREPLKVSAI